MKKLVIALSLVLFAACSSKPAEPAPAPAQEAAPAEAAAATTADTATVQKALNEKGAKLAVDGVAGNKTKAALRRFQKKNKLPVTGEADEATLKALGL